MTQAFSATASIDRPVDQVWSRLTDWPRAPEWMPGVDAIRVEGDGVTGTKLVVRARGKERVSEISAFEAGRSVTLTSVQGGISADYTYTCEPNGAGTRVTLLADVQTAGVWRLAGGLLRSLIRRADSGQLEALKRVVG